MGQSERIASKWVKTRIASRSSELARHIPETRRLSRADLARMLLRYGIVYAKPESGSLGVGVIKAERLRDGGCRVHAGTLRRRLRSCGDAYGWIMAHRRGRAYLAQRGIRVIRHRGRPADFRVMVQRNRARRWEVTGMLARVAHPGKPVTNGSQGGSIFAAAAILRPAAGRRGAERLIRRFRRIAGLTARQFGRSHPRLNELGLDIAVDDRLRSWLLEVNTRPDPRPFALLDDRTMLRRIVRLGGGYGRRYNLKVTKAKKG